MDACGAFGMANTVVIVSGRLFRYSAARRQSRAFVRDAAAALRDGRFDQVLAIAARNQRSHVAAVVAAGLAAFSSAPPEFSHAEGIAAGGCPTHRALRDEWDSAAVFPPVDP